MTTVLPASVPVGDQNGYLFWFSGVTPLLLKAAKTVEMARPPHNSVKVKGKGLVVLSGCAHAGVVNTVKHSQRIAGTDKLHAVLGGFHLSNAKPDIIEKTVEDIKARKQDHIVPTHCTGFEAIVSFAKAMPADFIVNTAGPRHTFGA